MGTQTKHILVIDDQPSDLKLLRMVLEDEDYQIVTCLAPHACFTLLQSNDFDLVILDQNMPGMDGFEVMEEIGNIRPGTPVVMITNAPTPQGAERAQKAGAFAYMGKPMMMNRILPTVRQALDSSPG